MRLEFNPRAMCYNLYCDTRVEQDKLKQMLEKPLSSTDLKSIDNMIYGRMNMTNRDYIVVHHDNKPLIIFKKYVVAIEKCDDDTAYISTVKSSYFLEDGYATVISQLI